MHKIRWTLLATLVFLLGVVPACQPAAQPDADPEFDAAVEAAERDAVIASHLKLVHAYENGDVDAFVSVLDPGAELLMFHPSVENRFDGVDEVRENMGRMFARLKGAKWSDMHADVHIEGKVAWLTSQVLVESPQLDPPFVGRSTEVFVRKPEGWRLVHGHWSAAVDTP